MHISVFCKRVKHGVGESEVLMIVNCRLLNTNMDGRRQKFGLIVSVQPAHSPRSDRSRLPGKVPLAGLSPAIP